MQFHLLLTACLVALNVCITVEIHLTAFVWKATGLNVSFKNLQKTLGCGLLVHSTWFQHNFKA